MQQAVGLAKVEFYDFYAENGKIIAMKERVNYDGSIGTNQNFIQNVFHFIQKIGFKDSVFLTELSQKQTTPLFAKQTIGKFLSNEYIPDEFELAYNGIPKVNLKIEDVLKATK